MSSPTDSDTTAFVLGGGGHLGAHQVGMLQALFEHDINPDMIIGTSIGAVNGAVVATDPTIATVERLTKLWTSLNRAGIFSGNVFDQLRTLAQTRTHIYSNEPLRQILTDALTVHRFEDLAVPFECVAASIEQSRARYFSEGSLVDAVLASSAVPGLLPPVELDGEHFLDGGLVASIPLDRAVYRGASTIYVLQVGRIEEPLVAPSKPWEVAMISFEISRRHRFSETLQSLPEGVEVHVLPTGDPKSFNDLSQYREKAQGGVEERIARSYEATSDYLTSNYQ